MISIPCFPLTLDGLSPLHLRVGTSLRLLIETQRLAVHCWKDSGRAVHLLGSTLCDCVRVSKFQAQPLLCVAELVVKLLVWCLRLLLFRVTRYIRGYTHVTFAYNSALSLPFRLLASIFSTWRAWYLRPFKLRGTKPRMCRSFCIPSHPRSYVSM